MENISYVTYDGTGTLTGAFFQVPPEAHADRIEVDEDTRANWTAYRANEARDGVELAPVVPTVVDLAALKVAKNAEIDQWRLEANRTHFPVGDKFVAVDVLSRSDIDGTAGYVSLFGAFPPNWPGGWKATDRSIIPMPTVDDFKAMYAAMIARGTENFNRSEALKATLATAATPEAIATIEW